MEPSEIESVIKNTLEVTHIEIQNPRKDGLHFEALVVSPSFDGKSLVEQHQLVMASLKGHFQTTLHALGLRTLTPKQWNDQQNG